jgi:hypothetical protein
MEELEILDEDHILTGAQYAKKGEIQSNLMKIYDEEEHY